MGAQLNAAQDVELDPMSAEAAAAAQAVLDAHPTDPAEVDPDLALVEFLAKQLDDAIAAGNPSETRRIRKHLQEIADDKGAVSGAPSFPGQSPEPPPVIETADANA